jgi:hypothetical protein
VRRHEQRRRAALPPLRGPKSMPDCVSVSPRAGRGRGGRREGPGGRDAVEHRDPATSLPAARKVPESRGSVCRQSRLLGKLPLYLRLGRIGSQPPSRAGPRVGSRGTRKAQGRGACLAGVRCTGQGRRGPSSTCSAGPDPPSISQDRTRHAKPRAYQTPPPQTLSISYIFDPSRSGGGRLILIPNPPSRTFGVRLLGRSLIPKAPGHSADGPGKRMF